LDIRILNCDRNETNLLIRKWVDVNGRRRLKLIPIDHGLSFPDTFEIYEEELE